jgi:hypothetical protein
VYKRADAGGCAYNSTPKRGVDDIAFSKRIEMDKAYIVPEDICITI